jgi:aspartyl-tRNA synthetase
MDVVGFPLEKAKERFGFLLDALEYGAPPHGGIAFGFDRVVALLTGTQDIRETIAFPKNKKAQNPMDKSPSKIDVDQLEDLGLKMNKEN